jgi:hypothetical protein
MTGWWLSYPSEKYESQLGLLFPIYGKIKFMFQATNQIQPLCNCGSYTYIVYKKGIKKRILLAKYGILPHNHQDEKMLP